MFYFDVAARLSGLQLGKLLIVYIINIQIISIKPTYILVLIELQLIQPPEIRYLLSVLVVEVVVKYLDGLGHRLLLRVRNLAEYWQAAVNLATVGVLYCVLIYALVPCQIAAA